MSSIVAMELRRRGEYALSERVSTYYEGEKKAAHMVTAVGLGSIVSFARTVLGWGTSEVVQAVSGFGDLVSHPITTIRNFFSLLLTWAKMSSGKTVTTEYFNTSLTLAGSLRRSSYLGALIAMEAMIIAAGFYVLVKVIRFLVAKIRKSISNHDLAEELTKIPDKDKDKIVEAFLVAGKQSSMMKKGLIKKATKDKDSFGGEMGLPSIQIGLRGKRKSMHPAINPPAISKQSPAPEEQEDEGIDEKVALEVPEGEELVIHETYGREPFMDKPWRKDVDPEYLERKHRVLRKLKRRRLENRPTK